MGEWIKLRGGGGADGIGDGNAVKNLKFPFYLNFQLEKCSFDSCKQRLRSLFDQVVVAFLKEKSAGKCHRPIPVLCGDGQPVDLFRLFWVVRKFGGYDIVSRDNMWGLVLEECGLGSGVIASIKLIYMRYLNELDHWLRQVFSKRMLEEEHCGFIEKLELLSKEMETRYSDLLSDNKKQEHIVADKTAENTVNEVNGFSRGLIDDGSGTSCSEDGGGTTGSSKKLIASITKKVLNCRETITATAVENGGENISACEINGGCLSAQKVVKKVTITKPDSSENVTDGEEKLRAQPGMDNMIPPKSDVGNVVTSRKRKQQSHSFSGMLSWLSQVAKCPDDTSIGTIPECSKWSHYGCAEFWAQALLVREALLIRKQPSKAAGEVIKDQQNKKARMSPSMYEDDVTNHQTTEKLRCSKRASSIKSHSCPCCSSSASPQIIHRETNAITPRAPPEALATVVMEKPSSMNDNSPYDVPVERQVNVGPRFQAEVPQWTGKSSNSDSKWLGTIMWAPEDGERNPIIQIGKGRQHQCKCSYPNSIECVRFHVAEKRLKLKLELGPLFHKWRFNLMGEEVSLSWTEEEEKVFKEKIKSYASSSNKFWNEARRFLPSKGRAKMVSYYFNVHLVQRRSYQNRVSPKDVDSDDDEKECGSIGGSFGYNAVYIPRSSSVPCVLNTESTKFV